MEEEIRPNKPKRQMINEYLEINESIDTFYNSISFIQEQTQYHSLGMLGPNKTGKSSLMNNLFYTQFPLHSNSKASKGIHISYSTENKWVLIDNEGLDSAYRKEESKYYYDHVLSLLCFILCDIIIINVLYSDIGRYSASCYDTVLLFYQQALISKRQSTVNRKRLLYVIRDFDETLHKKDTVTRIIKEDLLALWLKLNQKTLFEFEDFFELDIITIPSYFYQRDDYYKAIDQLRTAICSQRYMNNFPIRRITTEGQCHSFKEALLQLVKTVKDQYSFYQSNPRNLMVFYHSLNNKEQVNAQYKPLLTSFHCKSSKLLSNFKLEALELCQAILKAFDSKGIVYNEKQCYHVRQELDEEISHSLYRSFLRQVYASIIEAHRNMRKTVFSLYNTIKLSNYFEMFNSLIREAMNSYTVSLIEKKVYDKEWVFRIEKPHAVYSETQYLLSRLYLILLEGIVEKRLRTAFNEVYLQVILNYHDTKEVFWQRINSQYQSTVCDCLVIEEEQMRKAEKFTEEAIQSFIAKIKERSFSIAKHCYIQFVKHELSKTAIKLFEQRMIYEDYNCCSYRQLNLFDSFEIDQLAWKFSSFYITLFDTMKDFRLEPISKGNSYNFNLLSAFTKNYAEIITKEKLIELKQEFNLQVNNITQEINFKSNDTKAAVPLWLVILLLYFGRNTLLYLITTKWLIVLLFSIGTFIILIQMRLTFIFRTAYYAIEAQIRDSMHDLLHRKTKREKKTE